MPRDYDVASQTIGGEEFRQAFPDEVQYDDQYRKILHPCPFHFFPEARLIVYGLGGVKHLGLYCYWLVFDESQLGQYSQICYLT